MAGFTTQQLAALEDAIALGARRVKYGDREIEYTSTQEMIELRDRMKRELGLVQTKSRGRRLYFTTSKGLDDGG